MTKKERKKIAKQLAEYELVIQHAHDEFAKRMAEDEVMKLTSKITDPEDMEAIDAMVPDVIQSLIEKG